MLYFISWAINARWLFFEFFVLSRQGLKIIGPFPHSGYVEWYNRKKLRWDWLDYRWDNYDEASKKACQQLGFPDVVEVWNIVGNDIQEGCSTVDYLEQDKTCSKTSDNMGVKCAIG